MLENELNCVNLMINLKLVLIWLLILTIRIIHFCSIFRFSIETKAPAITVSPDLVGGEHKNNVFTLPAADMPSLLPVPKITFKVEKGSAVIKPQDWFSTLGIGRNDW